MPEPPPLPVEENSAAPVPATFGLRTLAKLTDLLVLSGFQVVLFIILSYFDAIQVADERTVVALMTMYFLLSVGYFGFLTAGGRQTLGYRLAGLRVVTLDRQVVGAGRAVIRAVLGFVSLSLLGYLVGLLDYLPVALTRSKQAGHDLLARTTVVRVGRPRSALLAVCIAASAAAPFVIVFGVIRPFFEQAYDMPSPGMIPTLRVGDRILVNKLVYDLRPLRRGDMVIFVAPERVMPGSPDFIKRVGGLPGDIVRTVRGRVVIDGHEYDHAAVRDGLGRRGLFGEAAVSAPVDQADHHVRFVAGGVLADGRLVPTAHLGDLLAGEPKAVVMVLPGYTLCNGKRMEETFAAEDPDYDLRFSRGVSLRHRYDTDQEEDEYSIGEQIVGKDEYERASAAADERVSPGQVLVFGDNRNDSHDSAYWGALSRSAVEGQVTWRFFPNWQRVR